MQIRDVLQVSELLKRFPNGFAVTPSGKIFEIIKNFQKPEDVYTISPPRDDHRAWGFLVVAIPLEQQGDQEKFAHKRISTQDFYKMYENHLIEDEEQIKIAVENLNRVGVGRDNFYTVNYVPENGAFRLVLIGEAENV